MRSASWVAGDELASDEFAGPRDLRGRLVGAREIAMKAKILKVAEFLI